MSKAQPRRGKCAVCYERFRHNARTTTTPTGKVVHEACGKKLQQQFDAAERTAQRAAQRNRDAVLSGSTYASQKTSSWRLGGSPSGSGSSRVS
ncbi:hypothetical protein ONR57_18150 [Hoyosella sp. YIM 151337]|uniref:hypothetical protein n=1 Tax=Hoyosella sp. YIM 151337 TaxID=2992742 RepID=UPI002235829C|nr:hypothetical protein [Hoyosella sp. YIM 151337]MCW4355230.1 hypothetical protein [Hoyosella sp. YIM 151337]